MYYELCKLWSGETGYIHQPEPALQVGDVSCHSDLYESQYALSLAVSHTVSVWYSLDDATPTPEIEVGIKYCT